MQNTPLFLIISCEYLSFLTEIYVIAGSEQIVPVQATVNTFSLSPSLHVTNTAGTGYTNVPGFQVCLAIFSSLNSIFICYTIFKYI